MKIAEVKAIPFLRVQTKVYSGVYRETLQQSQRKERLTKAAAPRHVVHCV